MKSLLMLFVLLISSDLPAQWGTEIRLTNDPEFSEMSYNNAYCMAASGDTIHVVWSDSRGGDGYFKIYYKRSTDNGLSWGSDTRLTFGSLGARWPSIAVEDAMVHIVYWEGSDQIYYIRSADAGLSWGPETSISGNSLWCSNPSVSVSNSTLHVVWHDTRDGNKEIYYRRSTNGGSTWETITRLTNNSFNSYFASAVASGLKVHTVWCDDRDGEYEIYYKQSSDNGFSWGNDIRLTNDIAGSATPLLSVNGSFIHLVWMDGRDGNSEIYYKRSADNGLTWSADFRMTNNSGFSDHPSVIVSNGILHLTWSDDSDGNNEIYYKRSTDYGLTWEPGIRLTNNPLPSYAPSLTVSGQRVYLVWHDYRDGNSEIYFKYNPNGNPVPVELASFKADVTDSNIELNWQTATETNNRGFEIERKSLYNDFKKIGFVAGSGTTSESRSYTYTDSELSPGIFKYRLKQTDYDGSFKYSPEVEAEVIGPLKFSIGQNYPNPFNPGTTIRWQSPVSGHYTLKVYDLLGNETAILLDEYKPAGKHEVKFDASALSSGTYFYTLQCGSFIQTRKMILVK